MTVYVVYSLVAVLSIYAWRNWFNALCGLIVMMAVIAHPSMPTNTMGIQGLNPWNVLFLNVSLSWWFSRGRERLTWDAPSHVNFLLLGYLGVFLLAFVRMFFDRGRLSVYGLGPVDLISDQFINTLKWAIPGLLLFHGCRTQKRVKTAIVSICLLYFLLAFQVIKYLPMSTITGGAGMRGRDTLAETVGMGPGLLGKVFAGGAWAALGGSLLFKRKLHRALLFAAFFAITLGQAFVGSRSGFVAWGVVGFAMCALRWWRWLLAGPVVLILFVFLFPAASDRLRMGFGTTDVTGESEYLITSGRNLIWPHVLKKISDSPIIGYGKDAMRRTGLTETLRAYAGEGEAVAHSHNAYLDMLLETGVVGLSVVMGFYGVVVFRSAQLFRIRDNPICAAAGGLAFAIIVSHLVAGIGSQSFFPKEGDFGIWCAIGLILRVSCDLARARSPIPVSVAAGKPLNVAPTMQARSVR